MDHLYYTPPPPVEIPQAIALDWDRTLGDVDAAMQRLYIAAEAEGIDTVHIQEARKRTENDGGSFDPLTFVSHNLDDDAYDRFADHFDTMPQHSIMYPDASRFLLRLQVANMPHSIITYGVNPEWQMMKITASGYRAATRIMQSTDKGTELARWRHPDDSYTYGQMLGGHDTFNVGSIALIDDKATAFDNLPDDCSGFLLQRPEQLLASQRGQIPESVVVIRSLDELHVRDGRLQAVPDAPPETPEQIRDNMLHVLDTRGCFGVYLPYIPILEAA